jgi:hypothetical protein
MSYEFNPKYLDSYGLPATIQWDGTLGMGDCCADYFNVLALTNTDDSKAPDFLEPDTKQPRRHPDASKWWGLPCRESRDQLLPILCYGAIRGVKSDFLRAVFVSHLKRCFLLAWNTRQDAVVSPWKFPDITFLEVASLWVRIYKPFGYKIILPILDLETLIDAALWRWYQPESNQITRNHMLVCIAHRKDPSIISKLADKINDYPDLIERWKASNIATGEYPTYPLFQTVLGIETK